MPGEARWCENVCEVRALEHALHVLLADVTKSCCCGDLGETLWSLHWGTQRGRSCRGRLPLARDPCPAWTPSSSATMTHRPGAARKCTISETRSKVTRVLLAVSIFLCCQDHATPLSFSIRCQQRWRCPVLVWVMAETHFYIQNHSEAGIAGTNSMLTSNLNLHGQVCGRSSITKPSLSRHHSVFHRSLQWF